jgi:Virulence-associated protein E
VSRPLTISLVAGQKPKILDTFTGSFREVAEKILGSDWCPGTFQPRHRKKKNCTGVDLLAFDVDGGLTLDEAVARLTSCGLRFAIATTRHHGREKPIGDSGRTAPPCDRFRVLFLLERRVTDPAEYKATWEQHRAALLPQADPAAKDISRFYFRSVELVVCHDEGRDLRPADLLPRSAAAPAPVQGEAVVEADKPEAEEEILGADDPRLVAFSKAARIARATRYLEAAVSKGGVAIEGQNGDHGTIAMIRKACWDLGLTRAEALDVLVKVWNPHCVPSWPIEDEGPDRPGLRTKIDNAYRYDPERRFGCKLLETADLTLSGPTALVSKTAPHIGDLEGSHRAGPLLGALCEAWVMRRDSETDKLWLTQIDDLVRAWLRINGYSYSYRRDTLLRPSGKPDIDVVAQIYQDLVDMRVQKPAKDQIAAAVARAWVAEEERALAAARELLAFDAAGAGEVSRFVRAVTGSEVSLDVAVLQHFVWQVKRKLFGLKVDHHLMPILSGLRGSGKSEAVRRLLSPLFEFFEEPAGFDALTDAQQALTFSRFLVLFFDELPKAMKADRDSLKGYMTRNTATARRLYSNGQSVTRPNLATLIGTCESRVADVLGDDKGMRRFYELRCLDRCDWSTINAIDYLALWRSVDENGRASISGALDELYEVQDTELRVDPFAEWAADNLVPSKMGTNAASLYSGDDRAYVESYKRQGYRGMHLTERQFRERLAKWANDKKRPWFKPGAPRTYRNDALGNRRVWLRLHVESVELGDPCGGPPCMGGQWCSGRAA